MTQKQPAILKRRFRQNFQQRMGRFKFSFPCFVQLSDLQEATLGKGELVA